MSGPAGRVSIDGHQNASTFSRREYSDDADGDDQRHGEQPVRDRRAVAELEGLERLLPQVVDDRLRRVERAAAGRRVDEVEQLDRPDRPARRSTNTVTGASCGQTSRQNDCHRLAPSIRAASSSSIGMSCSAAR